MSVDTVVKRVESTENTDKALPMDQRTTSEDNLETRYKLLEGTLDKTNIKFF